IKRIISECVLCRKLRAKVGEQKMADLPSDRLEECPMFSNVGLDVFGPYQVVKGKSTRRNNSQKKLWALLFTCLVSRAIHVEPLPALDTSSFKNVFRRFIAIRGPCKIIRSDRGTNFVGAHNQDEENLSDADLQPKANHKGCQWIFNPPEACHRGGVWERKIGTLKNAMATSLARAGSHNLSRDDLSTFFQEAANIVNNTPLWGVSSDPNDPCPLSPVMLITMKSPDDSACTFS
ncbi:Integrase catalytic core, partial [Trinorchestia longiramus]